ncbi:hypothetical protein CN97_06110 [Haematobacter massiliensis]|uniref:RDD domain-containing protein n=2 Tax=Haematobacter massiliensis TaxID=195105 RepID=A0A086YCI7_9RHOB|nr:hypothetical protein CN97_06110 [Haematobacter massiliensis]
MTMTSTDDTFFARGLPDPATEGAFYRDVAVKRFIAWGVDVALITIITAILVPLTAFTALFYLVGLYMVVAFFYRWIGLTRKSATIGQRLVSLEFRTFRGERLDTLTAFLHVLGYTVSWSFGIPQLISTITIMITPKGQSLTDMLLGTAAINRAARF